jgi:hypothetical protein
VTFAVVKWPVDPKVHKRFITITEGMRGHFPVHMWWNTTDLSEGFWEPWDSHCCSFDNPEDAHAMAREWAEAEDLPYLEPNS